MLTALVSPILIMIPFVLRKFVNGPKPLSFFKKVFALGYKNKLFYRKNAILTF
jgi:hypothetical protein